MHPLVRAAAAAAILTALGSLDQPRPPPEPAVVPPPRAARGTDGLPALCGPRTIPEGPVCVPLPAPGSSLDAAEPLEPTSGAHPTLELGRGLQVYDHIPRRPDRPAAPEAYAYPIGAPTRAPAILSGYDLDLPGHAQRHTEHSIGHGAVDLAATRGEPVRVASLEAQEGQAEVAYIGELFGTTVVTSHLVREAGRMRQYAVLYGHLERVGDGIAPGVRLEPTSVLGAAGDSGSPGIVHLHLEVRQLREGVSLAALDLRRLVNNAASIPCDPRNVLPLLPAPAAP